MDIDKFVKNKDVVSIERINESEPIQGIILDYSDSLILFQNIYDLMLDGFKVIDRSDIECIEVSDTDIFQKKIMSKEGIMDKVKIPFKINLDSWNKVYEYILNDNKYISIENEDPENDFYYIGKIYENREKSVILNHFDGTGQWDEELIEIKYKEITSLSFLSNYINLYEKYVQIGDSDE